MKRLFLFLVVLPNYACSSSIFMTSGQYDRTVDPATQAAITINLDKTYQTIDKNFYGSHIDSFSEIPETKLVHELQLGKIRIGGNDFDVYNWKNNKTINVRGELKNAPSFTSLHQDMEAYKVDGIFQVNLTGYQPEKVNNYFQIKRTFTPEAAYEMIKTLNGEKQLKIENVSLGNEFSIWNETHAKIWESEDAISADDYITRYIQYAIAVRRAQEEVNGNADSIKLWGPEMTSSWYDWNTGNFTKDCQWGDIRGQVSCSYGNGQFTNFIPYFLDRIKKAEADTTINPKGYKLLDYFSIHYYPNFRTKNSDPTSVVKDQNGKQLVAEMLESTRLWNDPDYVNKYDITSYRNFSPNILNRMKGWLKQYYPEAKLAINEFAVDSDYRSNSYHGIVRPLYMADSIGIFAKEGVSFVNQFVLSTPGTSPLPWSLIEGGARMPLFYMYKLFTNNFKGTVVEATDNLGDEVNAYATSSGEMVNLIVVNKAPISKKVQVFLSDKGAPKKLTTVEIPAWSASLLKLEKSPAATSLKYEMQVYGAKEMAITIDPSYQKKP